MMLWVNGFDAQPTSKSRDETERSKRLFRLTRLHGESDRAAWNGAANFDRLKQIPMHGLRLLAEASHRFSSQRESLRGRLLRATEIHSDAAAEPRRLPGELA